MATAFLFFAALSGCTRSVDDKSKVTIQLPSNNHSSASSKVIAQGPSVRPAISTSKWAYSAPTASTDFNCYAVAVSSPSLPFDISWSALSGSNGRVYTISGMFRAGATVDVDVPAGAERTISLIGFYVDNPVYCVDLGPSGGTLQAAHFSAPAWIASSKKDIAPSSDQITLQIPATISATDVFEESLEKPFASSSIVEVTATGLPATGTSTNASSITFNVVGFNATEYYYNYQSDVTCSSFVMPATGLSITGVPSITFGTGGLVDGPVAVCMLSRGPSGVQTVTTIYTWIKDTVTLTPSLGVATATKLSQPVITVNNVEVGSSIALYQTADCTGAVVGTGVAGATSTTIAPSSPLADGSYFFTVKSTDSGGNTSGCSASVTTMVDTVAPTAAPVLKASNSINGVAQPSGLYSGMTPYYAWPAVSDNAGGSGIDHYEVAITLTTQGDISNGWVQIGNVLNYTFINSGYFAFFLEGNTYTFSLRAVDAAGNASPIGNKYWTPYITDPSWNEQAYFKADQPVNQDQYASSIAIDGDRMVVGAPFEDSSKKGVYAADQTDTGAAEAGAVYVYKRNNLNQWIFEAYLKPDNTVSGQGFGTSVDISGDTIVVGSPGETANASGVSGTGSTNYTANPYGAVYTFKLNGGVWSQENYIKPLAPNPAAKFGHSVAIYKNTIVVGAPYHSSVTSAAGRAYVFERSTADWAETKILSESSVAAGNRFGWSVSIHEDKIAVSSYSSLTTTGAVEVFEGSGASWANTATIKSFNVVNTDDFGTSVSIYKNRLAVGAPGEKGALNYVQTSPTWMTSGSSTQRGAVFVFEKQIGTWKEAAYVKPSNSSSNLSFGKSVALFEDLLVVGAPQENSYRGRVYTYKIDGNYREKNYAAMSQTNPSAFGSCVSISNSAIAIGANSENSISAGVQNGSSYFPNFSTPTNVGAGFVYELMAP